MYNYFGDFLKCPKMVYREKSPKAYRRWWKIACRT